MKRKCESCGKRSSAPCRRKCWACIKKAWRESHPLESSYLIKKWNAALKGKKFTLTFADWEMLWESAPGLPGGNSPESLSVDRIDSRRGYEPGNCRIISIHENCSRGAAIL